MLIHHECAVAAAIALGSFALADTAAAHHPGGGGNTGGAGPIFTIPASTLDEGQTAVGVMFEYVRLRTLSDRTLTGAVVSGSEGVPRHGRTATSRIRNARRVMCSTTTTSA